MGDDDPEAGATGTATTESEVAPAATPPTRYFGRGAYDAIRRAAESTNRVCATPSGSFQISLKGLIALMLAPIFKESSNATTASSAPSPMTLSRYDEWSGQRSSTGGYLNNTNANANYGLYAFRNPYTPYSRAFWHPGIGIWQYDSAGLGAPYTAAERMHTGTVGGSVATIVARGYCEVKAAGGTDRDALFNAWRHWGYPCYACETAFYDLRGHVTGDAPSAASSGFVYLELIDGIDALGGTLARTCSVNGGASFPCWYVDPARAQGANWWATGLPVNDSDPTKAPTPLSSPFYVFKAAGREDRHWLRGDSGYGGDFVASRRLAHNARPRSGDPASGLSWASYSGLCDMTGRRGWCDPLPPASLQVRFHSVGGDSFQPLVGDFDDDGSDDVFWYEPGTGRDYLWWSADPGRFSQASTTVSGTYRPLVADIDGDGDDDIVWYGTDQSYLWRFSGRTFTSSQMGIPGGRQVFTADIGGDNASEIVWYGPGTASDGVLSWSGGRLESRPLRVNGHYRPVVGDFDANGSSDIIWYAAGDAADYVWWTELGGAIVDEEVQIRGTYVPVVGDFDGNGADDVVWYAPGSAGDYSWFGSSLRTFGTPPVRVDGTYRPIVAALNGDSRDDIVWYAPGPAADFRWRFSATGDYSGDALRLDGTYVPVTGSFGQGRDGILWYGTGAEVDAVWHAG